MAIDRVRHRRFDPGALRDLQVDVVLAAPGGEPGVTDRLLQTPRP
jgi:hypothetical protein